MIRRAIRRNPDAVIAVTGCYAQTSPAEVMAIPGVDLVIGNQDRDKIIDYVNQFLKERQPINAVRNIMKTRVFEEMDVPAFADRTRAFLKIQEGCNNFCTFCIIPWSRGLLRSRSPENVIRQAKMLVQAGYREIVLTGIHTGGYGEDLENYSLAQLLKDLDKVDGLKRLRISSIEASQITDEVLDVLNSSTKMCRHLHIPLQAGDDRILARMRRKYTTAEYAEKIERIRKVMPEVAITTDVIVGFPGETEEMFRNGYRFMEQMQFSEMHVFPYSKRSGTPAARMDGQVDEETKNGRVHELIDLSERMQLAYARRFAGKTLEVIPERESKSAPGSGWIMGYSDNYLQVVFKGSAEWIGQVCKVKITEAGVNECRGEFMGHTDTLPGKGGVTDERNIGRRPRVS